MIKEIYKGVTIRKYGTERGEGVYPICFTNDLDGKRDAIMHDTLEEARKYIDKHS